jgi:hypothetical protein
MLNIFILLSLIFIIHELLVLISPHNYDKQILKIKKDVSNGFINPNDRSFIIFNLIYFIWSIVGLFTQMWPYFIILFAFSYISGMKIRNCDETIKRLRHRRIDSLISILIIASIVISYFKQF